MKRASGLKTAIASIAIGAGVLIASLCDSPKADAGIIQWRNRVPAAESNPDNIGSYAATIEIGNGGTTGYDSGLDVDLDTSLVPSDKLFVTYVDHNPEKVEYEFTQILNPGESYTSHLSFENNGGGGFTFTPNTIEFLAADGNFAYGLKVNQNGGPVYTHFDSGNVEVGELSSWMQSFSPGEDHRNNGLVGFPNGWYYGELTITNNDPIPDADFNQDTHIDGLDYLIWAGGFGIPSGADHSDGDANWDGAVDGLDYLEWAGQFGTGASDITGIPEPTGLALALIAAGAGLSGAGRVGRKRVNK